MHNCSFLPVTLIGVSWGGNNSQQISKREREAHDVGGSIPVLSAETLSLFPPQALHGREPRRRDETRAGRNALARIRNLSIAKRASELAREGSVERELRYDTCVGAGRLFVVCVILDTRVGVPSSLVVLCSFWPFSLPGVFLSLSPSFGNAYIGIFLLQAVS